MKGIVFTELVQMVEDNFGDDMVDDIIETCGDQLSSEGAYTSVGSYSYQELVLLVTTLSDKVHIEVPVLLNKFGHHLFQVFNTKFSSFFEGVHSTFQLLESVDNHIHVEVKKLYPEAELPTFNTKMINDNTLYMEYISKHALGHFAKGLMEASAIHFDEAITIDMEDMSTDEKGHVIFTIKKAA